MTHQNSFTLINPQTKALAFRVFDFDDDSYFSETGNYNYYSMIIVVKGSGILHSDMSDYTFGQNSLLCFSVYQPFSITAQGDFNGILINFHPDFFCIHKHGQEVACNGVLFNNIYESPIVNLSRQELDILLQLADQLKAEAQDAALAQYEMMVSYLKIFLINASRIKANQGITPVSVMAKEPFILQTLKDAIEEHYKTKHSPGEYAKLLNISVKALNRLSKSVFNKTLSKLIVDRIIIEAKRELYLTSKPVKTIAFELGFDDEFYFSRLFKNNAEVSPRIFRNTVGFAKAEINS